MPKSKYNMPKSKFRPQASASLILIFTILYSVPMLAQDMTKGSTNSDWKLIISGILGVIGGALFGLYYKNRNKPKF